MKKVKIITIVLAIILVTMISFAGIYVKTQNRMENKIKEYELGRELEGGRLLKIEVIDEDETKKTLENYETVKKTIEKRLNSLKAADYAVSLNKEDGSIKVELSENNYTDTYAYYLTASGKVEIKEKDAENELISDSMIKKANYNTC